jgi:hypothetical protein
MKLPSSSSVMSIRASGPRCGAHVDEFPVDGVAWVAVAVHADASIWFVPLVGAERAAVFAVVAGVEATQVVQLAGGVDEGRGAVVVECDSHATPSRGIGHDSPQYASSACRLATVASPRVAK